MQNGSLEAVNKLLAGGGFDLFNEESTNKQKLEAAEQQYRDACEVAAAFRTQQGKKCLSKLIEVLLDPPTWVGTGTNFMDAAAYGFSREGQRSAVQYIQRCIEIMEKGPPTKPE